MEAYTLNVYAVRQVVERVGDLVVVEDPEDLQSVALHKCNYDQFVDQGKRLLVCSRTVSVYCRNLIILSITGYYYN